MPSKDVSVTLAPLQLDRPAAARIVVAMSGGVDSSVAAMIAARSGAEVIGVTLQLYDHGEAVKRSGACCAGAGLEGGGEAGGVGDDRGACGGGGNRGYAPAVRSWRSGEAVGRLLRGAGHL